MSGSLATTLSNASRSYAAKGAERWIFASRCCTSFAENFTNNHMPPTYANVPNGISKPSQVGYRPSHTPIQDGNSKPATG